ncbi:hypothetical protein F444_19628 [Phytophthora nicotianae P1976]|uniref:Uncharacterized protein n=1 Tax=Phytophthora nicotianae P1976 TaxID=1317066 RepID=A0A080Z760_PHYNI|nr:hypothetical protein F444_19628 [Phytophthora nicotianae P1976]
MITSYKSQRHHENIRKKIMKLPETHSGYAKSKSATPSTQASKEKHKSTHPLNPRSRPTKKPEGAKKRAAEANATVVERKKRHMLINLSSAKSRIICWECSGTGHTQAFHQKFLQRQVDPADDTEAHAQLADDDSDHDKEMAEEDEHVDEE